MENISNQLSYLKGLIDGLNVDPESEYGRIFEGIVNVLDEINDSVDDILEYQDDLSDQVDLIDNDLAAVEEELTDDDDYEDDLDDEFDDDDDFEYYEIDCPHCGAEVCLDEDFFDTDRPVICPKCGKEFDVALDLDAEPQEEE